MPGNIQKCKTSGCSNGVWTRGTGETGVPRVAVSDECSACAKGILAVEFQDQSGNGCPKCAYLVGHSKGCPRRDVDPKTEGWNAGLDAAEAAVRACLTSGPLTAAQVTRAVESITRLKK